MPYPKIMAGELHHARSIMRLYQCAMNLCRARLRRVGLNCFQTLNYSPMHLSMQQACRRLDRRLLFGRFYAWLLSVLPLAVAQLQACSCFISLCFHDFPLHASVHCRGCLCMCFALVLFPAFNEHGAAHSKLALPWATTSCMGSTRPRE